MPPSRLQLQAEDLEQLRRSRINNNPSFAPVSHSPTTTPQDDTRTRIGLSPILSSPNDSFLLPQPSLSTPSPVQFSATHTAGALSPNY
ncbi:hypothetical protein P9112_002133 [Eukaryota sp. TZLM1-RC]